MVMILCLNKSFFIHYTSNFESDSFTEEVIFELVSCGNNQEKKDP